MFARFFFTWPMDTRTILTLMTRKNLFESKVTKNMKKAMVRSDFFKLASSHEGQFFVPGTTRYKLYL